MSESDGPPEGAPVGELSSSIIVREEFGVRLLATADVRDRVGRILGPYFAVRAAREVGSSHWTVVCGHAAAPPSPTAEEILFSPPEDAETRLLFDPASRRIDVLSPETPEWQAQSAARLIRTLVRLHYYEQGTLFLHGGLVSVDGVGVGFVGSKRAGKTSSILSLLAQAAGASYVTNDDLALREVASEWVGLGWPRSVSVRKDTLAALHAQHPQLSIRLDSLRHPANPLMGRTEAETSERVLMYPTELAEQLARPIAPTAPLRVLIFPGFLPRNEDGSILTRLHTERALSQLHANLQLNPGKQNEFLLPRFQLPTEAELVSRLERLLERVPCYELRQSLSRLHEGSLRIQELVTGA